MFGTPRLDIVEGDARKLQFSGGACVLDVYLYPPAAGREPETTYIDARRPRWAGYRSGGLRDGVARAVVLDREALAAAAGALGVGVGEDEAGGEIVFLPVHRAADR